MSWWRNFLRRLRFPACPVCGAHARRVAQEILWPELIAEWELSPAWTDAFNRREGTICLHCGSNLRSMQLAEVLCAVLAKKTGARHRSLAATVADPRVAGIAVAEINAAGTLHRFLANLPRLAYSEFDGRSPGARAEDLMALSYRDESFDLVVTSETLEHLPDVDRGLREIRRVLKPDGVHVFTVPVVWDRPATRLRTRLEAGHIVHVLPPSHHGTARQHPDLVWNEFGADFVARCRAAGFAVSVVRDARNPALAVFVAARTPAALPRV